VEDNPADVGLVREALEEHSVDCELLLINNGEGAIRFIADAEAQGPSCPDLIILDLNLPKKPGRDVLEKIRESQHWRHVPVVVVTSSDAPRDRDDAGRLGASRYVRKPSRLADFLELGAVFKAMLEDGWNRG
jgi:CheY-like chemotaxis protein